MHFRTIINISSNSRSFGKGINIIGKYGEMVFESGNPEGGSKLTNAFQFLLLAGRQGEHIVVYVPMQVSSLEHFGAFDLSFLQYLVQTYVLLCFTKSCSLLLTFYSQLLSCYTDSFPALDNELIISSRPFLRRYKSAKYFFPFSFTTEDLSYLSTSYCAIIEGQFLCLPIENAALGDFLSGCIFYFSKWQSFSSLLKDSILSSLFCAKIELYLTQHLSFSCLNSSCSRKGLS